MNTKSSLSTLKQYTTYNDDRRSRQHGTVVLFVCLDRTNHLVFSSTASYSMLHNGSELKLKHVEPVWHGVRDYPR